MHNTLPEAATSVGFPKPVLSQEVGIEQTGLRAWMERLEKNNEIRHITAEVDPDLETSTVNYLAGKTIGTPAILFENLKGHSGYRALYNMLGSSLARICLALGEAPLTRTIDVVTLVKNRMRTKIPPVAVDAHTAPVNQNILTGNDIDLTLFPAPRMWPLDGGRYIGTANAVITMDPETGRLNVGTYRQMIQGRNRVTVYTSPGKDAGLDRQKWWAMGKPAPVAVAYGVDPALLMVAGQSFPKSESEYDYCGGLTGQPVRLFKSELTGLMIPADAEIVAEGFFHPGDEANEGPFGEFTAYYGRTEGPCPSVSFEILRTRNDPILTCALMADWPSNDAGLSYAVARAAKIWSDLDALGVPGIKGVWTPPEAVVFGMTVVSIKQLYAGHAAQVLALAAQCMAGAYFTKYVIVVDDDVDPFNMSEVLWAIATRSRPDQSIDILRETWSTFLDPSQNPSAIRPWGSKALINACMEHRHLAEFAARSKLSRPVYERVVARWQELGFDGEPPIVDVFEETPYPSSMPMAPKL
ncbi:MAG: UbiD family decarboxylase [Noviherbaspirillum sp.]|nr:UbiD family decarboxylase [Noviherbaspirillum sp.]